MKAQTRLSIAIFLLWWLILGMTISECREDKSFMKYDKMLPKNSPVAPSAPSRRGNNPPSYHPVHHPPMEKGMEQQYYV